MKEIECPYCGHEYDLCHDDGAFYHAEDEREKEECPKCEKFFMVTSSISWDFEGEKADCLNGSEHRWRKIYVGNILKDYPDLAAKEVCDQCDEERTLSPDQL